MELLVLGGTHFVGRAVVEAALARGWRVTALNRGRSGTLPEGAEAMHADRTHPDTFAAAIAGRRWDAVVDTWAGAPAVATAAARMLRGRAERFAYVSTSSVYEWGTHVDESSPLVAGDPDAVDGDYPALKRGAELGILQSFPAGLLVRAGLIVGPHEDIGRLPWWLTRIAEGGRFVAPGAPARPLQYIDARDLAEWTVSALASGLSGPFDVACRSGAASTAQLLAACITATGASAEPVWFSEELLEAAGVEPWTQLPFWVPQSGDFAGFLEADTTAAHAAGLHCRPIEQTVADTWEWLRAEGAPPQRDDRPVLGLPRELEARLLGSPNGVAERMFR